MTFDNSPPSGTPGVLVVFADPARLPPTPAARRTAIVDGLRRMFGDRARQVIDYVECDWATVPTIAGCVSPLPPGVLTGYGPALTAPVGRIHWAGTETSAIWNGYMDGAVRAGQRVAGEIVAPGSRVMELKRPPPR
jgi:monoamine oxidase